MTERKSMGTLGTQQIVIQHNGTRHYDARHNNNNDIMRSVILSVVLHLMLSIVFPY
jgi:hypothetical protein